MNKKKDGSVLLALYNPYGLNASLGGGAMLDSRSHEPRAEVNSRLCVRHFNIRRSYVLTLSVSAL